MVFANKVIKKSRRRGFSFMEILMACLIIVAISTGAVFVSGHFMTSGRYNATKSNVSAVALGVSQYRFEVGALPSTLAELTVKNGTYGPWVHESVLKDAWNGDLLFYHDGNQFAVWSIGANKRNESGAPLTTFGGDDIGVVAR